MVTVRSNMALPIFIMRVVFLCISVGKSFVHFEVHQKLANAISFLNSFLSKEAVGVTSLL